MAPFNDAPEEFDQTIFDTRRAFENIEGLALNLVKDQQR